MHACVLPCECARVRASVSVCLCVCARTFGKGLRYNVKILAHALPLGRVDVSTVETHGKLLAVLPRHRYTLTRALVAIPAAGRPWLLLGDERHEMPVPVGKQQRVFEAGFRPRVQGQVDAAELHGRDGISRHPFQHLSRAYACAHVLRRTPARPRARGTGAAPRAWTDAAEALPRQQRARARPWRRR